ncbi:MULTISPECIES: hypothetical protein [Streptomyces]|uniref:hypothetical protein n=1 Tax=Streptomyces TaxID=1883 RepID=UPI0016854CEE|nr:hypothetical protein [Streptomyces venezuelae]
MSKTSVPIPSGSDSEGVPAWLSVDAAAWAGARPGLWARPLWPVLALLATVVAAIALEPVPVCSDAVPCGPDWIGMVQVGLAVGLLYWFARLPELTLVAAPVLAVIVAWEELPSAGWASLVANLAVIAALGFGWAAAWARLGTRQRQRRLIETTARAEQRRVEPARPLKRGAIPIAAGLVLCAVAVGAIALGLRAVHVDEGQAARATRTEAEVTGRTDMSLRVRTDDGRRITVDALFPEDYRLGTTVAVLEGEGWRRLVAEPYDAFGWQLLVLACGLPGLSLVTTGSLARRRAAALHHGPVPALRVLERLDHEGRTWVYAADDAAGSTPLFACTCVPAFPVADEHEDLGAEIDAADDIDDIDDTDGNDDVPITRTRLREAVMLGAPYEGAELVFVTTGADGTSEVTRTIGPVRMPRPGKGPAGGVSAGSTGATPAQAH